MGLCLLVWRILLFMPLSIFQTPKTAFKPSLMLIFLTNLSKEVPARRAAAEGEIQVKMPLSALFARDSILTEFLPQRHLSPQPSSRFHAQGY